MRFCIYSLSVMTIHTDILKLELKLATDEVKQSCRPKKAQVSPRYAGKK